MNKIIGLFRFKYSIVFYVDKDNGTFETIANDVAQVLGLDLDEFLTSIERQYQKTEGEITIISELGLYQGIFKVNNQQSKLFIRWMEELMLPRIRKAGAFCKSDYAERMEIKHQQKIELKQQQMALKEKEIKLKQQQIELEKLKAENIAALKPRTFNTSEEKLLSDVFDHIKEFGEITPRELTQRFGGRTKSLKIEKITADFAKELLNHLASINKNIKIIRVRTSIKAIYTE